jgi:hypothetical protein
MLNLKYLYLTQWHKKPSLSNEQGVNTNERDAKKNLNK